MEIIGGCSVAIVQGFPEGDSGRIPRSVIGRFFGKMKK